MRNTTYFNIARKESLKSDLRCKIGAVLICGNEVIKGYNKRKTHPVFKSLHGKVFSIHAEMACVIGGLKSPKPSSVFVYREGCDGKPRISRPCIYCMLLLEQAGVKKIYYSYNNEFYGLIDNKKEALIPWGQ